MGGALLARWRDSGIASIEVIEPASYEAGWHKNLESLPNDYSPDVVVFAVKPQQLESILPSYRQCFGNKPLYISIAAGKTTDFFRKYLGDDIQMVRAMPSLPATIGKGTTIIYAKDGLSKSAGNIAKKLLESVGVVEWIEDEALMDAVTAVSGSGPAYTFLFMESLAKAGVTAGLSGDMARMLAIQTVRDSAILVDKAGESFEQLRKNVTSPGGTTEAALQVLMKGDALEKLVKEAVSAAAKRSKELAE